MSKNHPSTNYTSCMKIDGVPILPPLLTPDKRKEMAYYKNLALAVEERIKLLKNTRNLKKSVYSQELTNGTHFYNCGDHNYELVYADPDAPEKNAVCTTKTLALTPSCPNQSTNMHDNNLDIRNFASAPILQRSNSYTLDSPSPMLQAHLEKQGVFENGKTNTCHKENYNTRNHIGGCGDNNNGQIKIGMKRKLPMKYAVKSDYNGYSNRTYETELNTNYVSDQSSTEFIYSSRTKDTSKRKDHSIYSDSSSSANSSTENSNELETTLDMNAKEKNAVMKNSSYQASQYNESITDNNISQKTSHTNEIIIPLEAQKSIQNLFETIQSNHAAQMQKLMEQQKADQELLRQAFEKQQTVLLNEIHKSYSMSKIRNGRSDNSISNPDPEIPQLQALDNSGFDAERNQSIGSGSEFVQLSQAVPNDSRESLRRAQSSIGSYVESQCPSAKLSQECISSIISSSVLVQNRTKFDENTPNTTFDTSEPFYTPTDTPNKSKLERDYKKSIDNFKDLTIEDMNNKSKETICQTLDEESCANYENLSCCTTCEVQENASHSNISVESHNKTHDSNREIRSIYQEEYQHEEDIDPEVEIRDHAATVISAAARSYLVRRLLKTQKVCSIKRTIRETLLCALKLHGDGGIKTADADLHRRLVQQLNSACHELHDIFFKTTTAERMRMISCDRDIMTGCYRHPRAGSTMSNNSVDNRYRLHQTIDQRQHSRHTSSRSLDKHGETNYGKT